MGLDTKRVVSNGYVIAMDLGASSPNTICKSVMIKNETGSAICSAVTGEIDRFRASNIDNMIFHTDFSPIHHSPKLANVIPSCVAER